MQVMRNENNNMFVSGAHKDVGTGSQEKLDKEQERAEKEELIN